MAIEDFEDIAVPVIGVRGISTVGCANAVQARQSLARARVDPLGAWA